MAKGHILIVDDEPSILRSLEGILGDEGFQVTLASDGEVAMQRLQEHPVDLVLLDIWMPGMDGIQTLQRMQAMRPGVCVIVMSGHGNIETAVKATKLGAFDYLEKPLSLDSVLSSVNAACDHLWKTREPSCIEVVEVTMEPLIGVSRAQQELRTQLERAAGAAAPLLIMGEPGSGKEFVAHLLHQQRCERQPFVRVSCGALSAADLERILAGGAGLEALLCRAGELPRGHGLTPGTLYLDGLERLSPPLLRACLRELTARAAQGQGPALSTGGRIVAAACRESGWAAGVFPGELRDLFDGSIIATIPLRERAEDIPLLAEHFLRRAARRYGSIPKEIHAEAMRALLDYDWPGNVKELKAMLERVVLMTPNAVIGVEHLPHHLARPVGRQGRPTAGREYASLKEARRAWERQYLLEQLRRYQWNAAEAAQALCMKERSLQRRLSVLGIRRDDPGRHSGPAQRTLKRSVVIYGQGLQSGVKTGMILSPLAVNSGVLFGDIATGETIPAEAAYVESTGYATSLRRGLVTARTVEHIMAALHMYGITNVLVKIGGEVPFMDGSARDFCQLIEEAGVQEQAAAAPVLCICERQVWGRAEPGQKHFVLEPAPHLTITYHLEYPSPIGRQEYTFTAESPAHFKRTIAPARTFGFVKEIGQLHALGMANGGRLTNVILLDESRVINTELRFPDEFVRHKVLDLLGDLFLTGKLLRGKITAYWTGHTENLALVKALLSVAEEG